METRTQSPSFTFSPAKVIAHNTALKLNNPLDILSTGTSRYWERIPDNTPSAKPYNAAIGEQIKTATKNKIPESNLP